MQEYSYLYTDIFSGYYVTIIKKALYLFDKITLKNMASRKDLKKDIDYLVYELVADCYGYMYENPEMDLSGFEEIINGAVQLKENLITKINQYDPDTNGNSRKYFKIIRSDLVDGLKAGYEKLNAILG